MVSAAVAVAVNFLAAARDIDFKWYATWNGVLGAVLGADLLAAAEATTAGLAFAFIILVLRR